LLEAMSDPSREFGRGQRHASRSANRWAGSSTFNYPLNTDAHKSGACLKPERLGVRHHAGPTREYHSPMQVAAGTVVGGKVVVEGLDPAEGETVTVLTHEPEEEVHLSPEEEAELLEAIAEADRGETISAEELFARLDRIR
jgi:hypothetical protein